MTTKVFLESKVFECLSTNNYDQIPAIQKALTTPELQSFYGNVDPVELAAREVSFNTHAFQLIDQQTASSISKVCHQILIFILHRGIHQIFDTISSHLSNFSRTDLSIGLFYSLWYISKELLGYLQSLHETVHEYLPPIQAYLSEVAALSTILALCYLYKRYNIGLKSDLEHSDLKDLTEEARLGAHFPSTGIATQENLLVSKLSSAPIGSGMLVFLLGPPGCGKTQCVKGLAALIAKDQIPALQGRSILQINTAQLSGHATECKLNQILDTIHEREDRVVVFFDEAHTAAENKEGPNLLQLFKTKIEERNVTAIFATTLDEYNNLIAKDKALDSRARKIFFSSLDEDSTKLVLDDVAKRTYTRITPEAIIAIVEKTGPGTPFEHEANPRKSLIQLEEIIKAFRQHVLALQSGDQTLPKNITDERERLVRESSKKNEEDPSWISTQEAIDAHKRIKQLDQEIQAHRDAKKPLIEQYAHFETLLKLEREYTRRRNQLALKLQTPHPQTARDYLFTKFVLVPQTRKAIQAAQFSHLIDERFVQTYFEQDAQNCALNK